MVPTGTDSMVPTGTDSMVLTATDSMVLTGTDSIVLTGTDSMVLTGADSRVLTGTDSMVPTGTDSMVLTGTDNMVLAGTDSMATQVSQNKLQRKLRTLKEKAEYDIVVLVGKKMKKGFSVETMCTPGFAKHFIGQDKKNRPKTGVAVMNLFKSHLQDYYKNPQMLASSDKDSGLEHMEEEEEVADLEEQQESLDNQMELDENEERYEDQPVAGSLNDNLMREDDHETEGDANKSVGNLMQNIQMTDDEEEREKTDGNQSGDSLMKNNKTIMEIPIGHFVPVFGLTSLEGDYWLFRVEKIMKTVIKGTYLNKIVVYEVGQADKIKPKNIVCFEDGGFRSFSLTECENSIHLPQRRRSEDVNKNLCRVRCCRNYGRAMADIYRHVKEQHPSMSFQQHQWLPLPTEAKFLEKVHEKEYMKYRKIESCYVRGCKNFGQPYRNLAQHLKTQHNLDKKEYNRMYPVINVTYHTPNHASDMSIVMPGERIYNEKPDIGTFSDLPDKPKEGCPIQGLDERFGFWPLKDEEKFWFIRTWLKDQRLSDALQSDQYPAHRVYHLECDPRGIFQSRDEKLVYHEGYLSLNLRQMFAIQKKIHSREEEYYFLKAVTSPGFSNSRFHKGIYEFECCFCEKIHQTWLLYSHVYEPDKLD
eukprot:gene10673-11806_t